MSSEEATLIAKGRRMLYLSLLHVILGLVDQDTIGVLKSIGLSEGEIRCILNVRFNSRVKARDYRLDLDPVSRSLIHKVIEQFYSNAGYTIEGFEVDSLEAMISFIAKLVDDEVKFLEEGDLENARRLRMIQLRFINTHLKPLLDYIPSDDPIGKAISVLKTIVESDVELLKELLTK